MELGRRRRQASLEGTARRNVAKTGGDYGAAQRDEEQVPGTLGNVPAQVPPLLLSIRGALCGDVTLRFHQRSGSQSRPVARTRQNSSWHCNDFLSSVPDCDCRPSRRNWETTGFCYANKVHILGSGTRANCTLDLPDSEQLGG
ncbi:hypothetical protein AAFF_G00413940 [Aldrovandia affinis]|uniref:Uncharacterized protein n=1 Tax=Aldrovandia affinis TaxID=143900 RepID=A0AAD7WJI3_9TELE|nr:hypothetical protein AAFF_G00413940 [Aldrovandia affinis]